MKLISRHKSNIMAGSRIFRPRIAQTNHQKHRHLLFTHKINVNRLVRNRMELNVLANGFNFFAFNINNNFRFVEIS